MRRFFCTVLTLLCIFILMLPSFAALPQTVIPGGETVGITLDLGTVRVTKTEEDRPAAAAGLQVGDVILSANGQTLKTADEFAKLVETGKPLALTVNRNGKETELTVSPVLTNGTWQIGAKVINCISGIGTVTYFDPQSDTFGALGHGVNLPDTLSLLDASSGNIFAAEVAQVEKSESGAPGELKGSRLQPPLGEITQNTENGIFGTAKKDLASAQPIPVATSNQVHPGTAVIRCCTGGTEVQEYSVQITEIYPQAENGRDLRLKITDKTLLQTTGGIVRGMSGSPIIQDGRLVGAVTHVLVDEPTQGYGVLIETMMNSSTACAAYILAFWSVTTFVAILSQNALSCSTNKIVGLLAKIKSSTCLREMMSI